MSMVYLKTRNLDYTCSYWRQTLDIVYRQGTHS